MKHPPNKLALLISVIGAGAGAVHYASVRSGERPVGLAHGVPGAALQAPPATALERTRWSPGLAWRADEGPLGYAEPLQAWYASHPFGEEWAHGEVPELPWPAGPQAQQAAPTDLMMALLARAATVPQMTRAAASRAAASPHRAAQARLPAQRTATLRLPAAPQGVGGLPRADGLLSSPAPVGFEELKVASPEVVLSKAADGPEAPRVEASAPEAQPETHAGKVLHLLESMGPEARGDGGAIQGVPTEAIAAAAADGLHTALAPVAAARKVLQLDVDLALPLTARHAAAAPLPASGRAAVPVDIDLTLPRVAGPVAVAAALPNLPALSVAPQVDIDLTLPLAVGPTAHAVPVLPLSAELRVPTSTADVHAAAAPLAAVDGPGALPPREAAGLAAATPGGEPGGIVVASHATKVLRTLQAILDDERDEFGAIRAEPRETIVATQSDKVLATLAKVASTGSVAEDEAARKALKRAAATPGAEVTAAAAAWAALPEVTRVYQGGNDLVGSLGAAAPIATGPWAAPAVDIDLALPLSARHAAAAAPIAAAVYARPDLDLDLSIPRASAAAASAVDIDLTPRAPRPLAPSEPRPSPFGGERMAVSEEALDGVRGGFVGDNLNVSFGIERAVYINGALVTTTRLNVSDLGRTAGRGASGIDAGTLTLVQNGTGNVVAPGTLTADNVGTVIQNTLDGQKIQNLTVVNATVNSLGVMKGLNLQSSMRGAVIDSLRR